MQRDHGSTPVLRQRTQSISHTSSRLQPSADEPEQWDCILICYSLAGRGLQLRTVLTEILLALQGDTSRTM